MIDLRSNSLITHVFHRKIIEREECEDAESEGSDPRNAHSKPTKFKTSTKNKKRNELYQRNGMFFINFHK